MLVGLKCNANSPLMTTLPPFLTYLRTHTCGYCHFNHLHLHSFPNQPHSHVLFNLLRQIYHLMRCYYHIIFFTFHFPFSANQHFLNKTKLLPIIKLISVTTKIPQTLWRWSRTEKFVKQNGRAWMNWSLCLDFGLWF